MASPAEPGEICGIPRPPPELPRLAFGFGPGARVVGWPRKGGMYVLPALNGLDLDFLGLDRFKSAQRSQDPAEEDALCVNMRRLGAVWWKSSYHYSEHQHSIHFSRQEHRKDSHMYVGWPSGGGVWVIKTTFEDAGDRGLGKIGNAYSMDERCEIIKEFGGIFYAEPEKCPHLHLVPGHARTSV